MPRAKTTADFIVAARLRHGDAYDYNAVEYKSCSTPVTIWCIKHGVWFRQTPNSHIHQSATGCKQCSLEKWSKKRTKTTPKFIEDAKKVHGDRFDYSRTEYRGAQSKLTIICREHGEFSQLATNHLAGYGCAKCAADRQIFHENHIPEEERDDPAWIYVLLIEVGGERFSKIGYTSVFDSRMYRYKNEGVTVIKSEKFPATKYAGFEIERLAHEYLDEYKVRPSARFGGMTECYPEEYYGYLVDHVDCQTG